MDSTRTALTQMDFAMVKMGHRTWRMRLRRYLDGTEDIDPKTLVSHRNCELGKWIYATGMSNFGDVTEMKELEEKHKVMHGLVQQVVDLKFAGRMQEAEEELSKVYEAAENVVSLINAVERKVLRP